MVNAEMFLDSAQKLDSVMSHAKELNYVPESSSSSVANVAFTVSTTGISLLKIPRGITFEGKNSNGSFTFTTSSDHIYASVNNYFNISNLNIYEGKYVTDSFAVDYTNEQQMFTLSNKNIDINSLIVTVFENNGSTQTVFQRSENLYDLNNKSNIYFIQASQNSLYEIVFGDNVFGRTPLNGSIVTAEYRVTSGSSADGIYRFDLLQDLGPLNGGNANVSTIAVTANSIGGSAAEGIESIRYAAPRYFAAQHRAVSVDDYVALILNNFGGQISDIIVYGGQDLEPKMYGRVAVCIKPNGSTIAPDYLKNSISLFLQPYIALPNRIVFTNPNYLYLKVNTKVSYKNNVTTKYPQDIKSLVTQSMKTFSEDNLEKFNNNFKYSQFITAIDDADSSIVSNDTDVQMIQRIEPTAEYFTSYYLNYGNPIEQEGSYNNSRYVDESTVTSSPFTYIDANGNKYQLTYLKDDTTQAYYSEEEKKLYTNRSNIIAYTYINNVYTVLNNKVGYVDYPNGVVTINNLKVATYDTHISVYAKPKNKNINSVQNLIIMLDTSDIDISITEVIR
jgi:hypothetical protein